MLWLPARLIKEGGCVDLPMDTLHLKLLCLVLFGSKGSALSLPLFLLSPRIISLGHCSSTMTKGHFLLVFYGTKWPLCVDVPLNTHSFNHSSHVVIRYVFYGPFGYCKCIGYCIYVFQCNFAISTCYFPPSRWHLGYCKWEYTPTYRGFDTFYGRYNGRSDYYNHSVGRRLTL